MNGQAAVSLGKIIKAAEAGELGARDEVLGGCVYESADGKHCAIGCLLSRGILDDLKRQDKLHLTFVALDNMMPDIKDEIGFTFEQAAAIQNWHDTCYADRKDFLPETFIELMRDLVSYKRTEIAMNPFDEADEDCEPLMVSFAN